jgi:hypothetical protein
MLFVMSTAVAALLRRLTIPEKVEVLQTLLDVLPDDVMWPSWLENTGEGDAEEGSDDLKLREDPVDFAWPASVAADPDHCLRRLSLPELAQLTESLWAEVGNELPVPDWLIDELDERKRRVDSGEAKLYTIDEAMAAVRKEVGL